ncbi:hypothetical protein [Streptomyces sp. NPDC088727]|uniref:hypothetical protein n=1 Tax=Streptomyces sp. NPDC088727 TaxID=3365875 RepID=UPI003821CFB4
MTTTTVTTAALCAAVSQSRWTQPVDPMDAMGEWTPDPGPYTVGDPIKCDRCGADTTVAKTVTNPRSAGTQYVAFPAPHADPARTHEAARARLHTTVREILTTAFGFTATVEDAEAAIMAALEQCAPTPTPAT